MAQKAKQKKKKQSPRDDRSARLVSDHLGQLTQFENRRSTKEEVWQKIADFVQPQLEDIEQTEEPGEQYGLRMFDGTAPRAHEIATNGTYSNVISQNNVWFRPRAQLNDLNDVAEVRAYLQDVGESLMFALDSSNFYKQAIPFIADGLGIGTATTLIEEDEDGAIFNTIHPAQIFLDEDKNGKVDTVYRKYKVEIRHLVEKFGIDSLNEQQQKMLKDNPFKPVQMLHVIAKRQEYDPFKFDNVNMPYASIWIDIAQRRLMGESGFESFPAATWRYFVNSGEIYGRSPAEMAIATIEGTNQMAEDMLYVSETGAMPPVQAPQDMRGKVKIGPREINYLSGTDQISAINLGQNYSIGVDREERQQDAIREAFNVDFFLLLASGDGQKTAFEVAEIQSEKALILAPTIARLTKEFLDPVLERVFDIESRAGRMPDPPPILEDMGENGKIEISYLGPLAQIQARLFESRGIVTGLQEMLPVIEVFPESRDKIDGDEIIEAIAKSRNWPERTLRSDEQVAEIRMGRQQDQAEAEQLAKAGAGAKALKDAAAADNDLGGAITEQITEAVSGQGQA
jgi:hypothetical protein